MDRSEAEAKLQELSAQLTPIAHEGPQSQQLIVAVIQKLLAFMASSDDEQAE